MPMILSYKCLFLLGLELFSGLPKPRMLELDIVVSGPVWDMFNLHNYTFMLRNDRIKFKEYFEQFLAYVLLKQMLADLK